MRRPAPMRFLFTLRPLSLETTLIPLLLNGSTRIKIGFGYVSCVMLCARIRIGHFTEDETRVAGCRLSRHFIADLALAETRRTL